jgi:hypothetical protein
MPEALPEEFVFCKKCRVKLPSNDGTIYTVRHPDFVSKVHLKCGSFLVQYEKKRKQ